mmetsp:Transcript_43005/g.104116  ORF Transcript_43005/g.104116 Transcript_43005/m.104116 type:complete len:238 (+) Transcript_43005:285-998(+)
MVSSSINPSTSSHDKLGNNCISLSKTPAMSVKNKARAALSSPAILPAATSALTLYAMSFSSPMPVPIGETTGQMPMSKSSLRSLVLTVSTSPTNPKSYPCLSIFLTHCNKESSRPDKPKARPPELQMVDEISLLTEPHKTISATSTTSEVLTRIPPSKRVSTPTVSSMFEICGPPPCTTTMRIPKFCKAATSWQNPALSSGDVMALPPYLTTIVLPRREAAASAMVIAEAEKSSEMA